MLAIMRVHKVILLGDLNVGKTSLIQRFVDNNVRDNTASTIGVDFVNKSIEVDSERIVLQIWDTAGHERFRTLRVPFYRGADCCVLVFSLTDRRSFDSLAGWVTEFRKYSQLPDDVPSPIVVLGNKVDGAPREVGEDEAREWCRAAGLQYWETSAKDALNVDRAFETAAREAVEWERTHPADERRFNAAAVLALDPPVPQTRCGC